MEPGYEIGYGDKYEYVDADGQAWETRNISLGPLLAAKMAVQPNGLLREQDWRNLGLVQSHGWKHVATYRGRHLTFRREADYIARHGNRPIQQDQEPFSRVPAQRTLQVIERPLLTTVQFDSTDHVHRAVGRILAQIELFRPTFQLFVFNGVETVRKESGGWTMNWKGGSPHLGAVGFRLGTVLPTDRELTNGVTPEVAWFMGKNLERQMAVIRQGVFDGRAHANGWTIFGNPVPDGSGGFVVEEFAAFHRELGVVVGDTTDIVQCSSKAAWEQLIEDFPLVQLPEFEE